jgi:hypothetical protein
VLRADPWLPFRRDLIRDELRSIACSPLRVSPSYLARADWWRCRTMPGRAVKRAVPHPREVPALLETSGGRDRLGPCGPGAASDRKGAVERSPSLRQGTRRRHWMARRTARRRTTKAPAVLPGSLTCLFCWHPNGIRTRVATLRACRQFRMEPRGPHRPRSGPTPIRTDRTETPAPHRVDGPKPPALEQQTWVATTSARSTQPAFGPVRA